MKKFLLTAALVLALVTSLTAGTMAYYNVDVATTAKIKTKNFVFDLEKDGWDATETFAIAPGEQVDFRVNLTNGSDVDLDSTLIADVSDSANVIDVKVTIDGVGTATRDGNKKVTIVNKMEPDNTVSEYTITVEWPRGDSMSNDDTANAQGKTFTLNISANGMQAAAE